VNDVVLEAAKRLAAADSDTPRLDARLLWQHAQISGRGHLAESMTPPRKILAHSDFSTLPQGGGGVLARFESLVARREKREPIAYILGRKEFWSLDFEVGSGVLVPRPDTETLIEEAIRLVPDRSAPLHIADLGAGSGAILIAVLKEFPNATGIGFESSSQAYGYAMHNAARLIGVRAEIRLAEWDGAEGPFDLVFSNPPYIPSADIESLAPDVSQYEPRQALDGGADGLEAYRGLAKLLPGLLKSGGHALLEIGLEQAITVEPLFRDLEIVRIAPDLSGIPRCVILRKA
jgi:release factor glutamine methyltransferase